MDRTDYEAVVVGVGGMGSAAVAHLAARGVDVLGIERFDVPHANGSSHGETRIVRAAYGEGAAYVPLVARAYELWRDLESTAGERLLTVTGSVTAGPAGDDLVPDAVAACEAHDLAHEVVDGATLTDRYAALSVPASYRAVVQPDGGFLAAERCVAAHVDRAHAAGAEVHGRERVVDWRAPESGGPVRVTTDRGTYVADHLVVAAGAWAGRVCPALGDALTPERQVQAWLQPTAPTAFDPDRLPVFVIRPGSDERPPGVPPGNELYGVPHHRRPGFKVGVHHHRGRAVDPDDHTFARSVSEGDERLVRGAAEAFLTGVGPTLSLEPCLYTNSPDRHFVIDRHPEYDRVSLAAGFSGHGFKFASVVGETLADFVTDGRTDNPVGPFGVDRL